MTDQSGKSISAKGLELVLRLMRFKQGNSYDKYLSMKNMSKPLSTFFSGADIKQEWRETYVHWIIEPKLMQASKQILYFHGGAYVSGFNIGHWSFLADLYKRSSCGLQVPDYPRAPGEKVGELLSGMRQLYMDLKEKYGQENLILMGDSAGAGLALVLSQSLSQEDQPSAIFLLSPWLDLSMENPDIEKIDDKDVILNVPGLIDSARAYAGGLDLKDPKLSPLYGNMDALKKVIMYSGDHDILMPDCRLLYDKLKKNNSDHEYYEIEYMQHCGMLFPTREGQMCRDMIIRHIIEILRKDEEEHHG